MPVARFAVAQIAVAAVLLAANLIFVPEVGLLPPVPELVSLMAAFNAEMIRRRAGRFQARGVSRGLWVAAFGGFLLLLLAASPYWIPIVIPPAGLFTMFAQMERTITMLAALALAALLGLLVGWSTALLSPRWMRRRPA